MSSTSICCIGHQDGDAHPISRQCSWDPNESGALLPQLHADIAKPTCSDGYPSVCIAESSVFSCIHQGLGPQTRVCVYKLVIVHPCDCDASLMASWRSSTQTLVNSRCVSSMLDSLPCQVILARFEAVSCLARPSCLLLVQRGALYRMYRWYPYRCVFICTYLCDMYVM